MVTALVGSVLAALVAAGCGGGGGDDSSADAEQATTETVTTSEPPTTRTTPPPPDAAEVTSDMFLVDVRAMREALAGYERTAAIARSTSRDDVTPAAGQLAFNADNYERALDKMQGYVVTLAPAEVQRAQIVDLSPGVLALMREGVTHAEANNVDALIETAIAMLEASEEAFARAQP